MSSKRTALRWTFSEWKRQSEERLIEHGVEPSEAKLEVRLIAEHAINFSQVSQITHKDRDLTEEECHLLEGLVIRRCQREPLAHLLGEWEFWGLPIKVTKETLIPRADTEVLVEEACKWLSAQDKGSLINAEIIDIGAGSGCISMAMASEYPSCSYLLIDLSEAALEIAKQGWEQLISSKFISKETRVGYLRSDGLSELKGFECSPLLIVSNPPYIKRSAEDELMPEVRSFDPHLALFDERPDGLGLAERFIVESFDLLCSGGALFMEVGFDQTEQTAELFSQAGYISVNIRSDYGGNPRVVSGIKPVSAKA